jgi:hypothetical protein
MSPSSTQILLPALQFGISCEGKCTQEEQQQWLSKATAAAAKMGATATRLVYDPESQAGEHIRLGWV